MGLTASKRTPMAMSACTTAPRGTRRLARTATATWVPKRQLPTISSTWSRACERLQRQSARRRDGPTATRVASSRRFNAVVLFAYAHVHAHAVHVSEQGIVACEIYWMLTRKKK